MNDDFKFSWFAMYEKTMGTSDEELLKSCLIYYCSEGAQKNFVVDFLSLDYKTLKAELAKKPAGL